MVQVLHTATVLLVPTMSESLAGAPPEMILEQSLELVPLIEQVLLGVAHGRLWNAQGPFVEELGKLKKWPVEHVAHGPGDRDSPEVKRLLHHEFVLNWAKCLIHAAQDAGDKLLTPCDGLQHASPDCMNTLKTVCITGSRSSSKSAKKHALELPIVFKLTKVLAESREES